MPLPLLLPLLLLLLVLVSCHCAVAPTAATSNAATAPTFAALLLLSPLASLPAPPEPLPMCSPSFMPSVPRLPDHYSHAVAQQEDPQSLWEYLQVRGEGDRYISVGHTWSHLVRLISVGHTWSHLTTRGHTCPYLMLLHLVTPDHTWSHMSIHHAAAPGHTW